MSNSFESRFKNKRQQTDKSLSLERNKTDNSFETYNEHAEIKTDKIVETGRRQADEARNLRRSKADLKRNISNQVFKRKDDPISIARELEDEEIKFERSSLDEALNHEREEKERLMARLLKKEREETDKNLLGERKETDLESARSQSVLQVEQAAHTETKSDLTTREEFIAIVSHDLRNPIGTILSAAEVLLEDQAHNGMNEEAKRWIEMIKRNATTSLRLISDILDMERVIEGKIQLRLAKNSINATISETIESYSAQAKAKSITLKADLLTNLDPVNFDKDRILQVLSNLIGNALKFTPLNGQVNVLVKDCDRELEICVEDSGPGIPENQRIRIFEKFAQFGNKQRSGIGLGLYISKTLVEAHLGKIWVTSDPGHGSKFIFSLPKQINT